LKGIYHSEPKRRSEAAQARQDRGRVGKVGHFAPPKVAKIGY